MEVERRFHLHDHLVVYNEIEALERELLSLVHDTNAHLSPYLKSAGAKLQFECPHLRLEEPNHRHHSIAATIYPIPRAIRRIGSTRGIRIDLYADA